MRCSATSTSGATAPTRSTWRRSADELAPKPATLTHAQAAAVPLSALTAWQALFDHGELAPGQRVLVHGGAGGVGSFAVQLARWRGAHVTATSSARDADLVRELGADEVIDYRSQRFEDVVADLDLVFDTVGGETWERSWSVLRPAGRLVSIAVPRPPDREPVDDRRAIWFVVRPDRGQLIEIGRLIDAGRVRPIVSAELPLAEGHEAYGPTPPARRAGQGRAARGRRARDRSRGVAVTGPTDRSGQMSLERMRATAQHQEALRCLPPPPHESRPSPPTSSSGRSSLTFRRRRSMTFGGGSRRRTGPRRRPSRINPRACRSR